MKRLLSVIDEHKIKIVKHNEKFVEQLVDIRTEIESAILNTILDNYQNSLDYFKKIPQIPIQSISKLILTSLENFYEISKEFHKEEREIITITKDLLTNLEKYLILNWKHRVVVVDRYTARKEFKSVIDISIHGVRDFIGEEIPVRFKRLYDVVLEHILMSDTKKKEIQEFIPSVAESISEEISKVYESVLEESLKKLRHFEETKVEVRLFIKCDIIHNFVDMSGLKLCGSNLSKIFDYLKKNMSKNTLLTICEENIEGEPKYEFVFVHQMKTKENVL